MEHLIEQNLVKSPLFTVHLDKYGDAEKSFYTFGYIDHSALPVGSHITYVDVNSANGFWEFPSPSIQVGRHTAHRHPNNTAIADTGKWTAFFFLRYPPTDRLNLSPTGTTVSAGSPPTVNTSKTYTNILV